MARAADILKLLQRNDKQSLGGGGRLLWAPRFPLFAEVPGFWDEAQYYQAAIRPLFTWTLLDQQGTEIPLRFVSRHWDPSVCIHTFAGIAGRGRLSIKESRSVLASDVASSEITVEFRGKGKCTLHMIAWTAREIPRAGTGVPPLAFQDGVFTFTANALAPALTASGAFGFKEVPHSFASQVSDGALPPPRWNLSPFAELFRGGRLPGTVGEAESGDGGVLYAGIHCELEIQQGKPAGAAVGFAISPAAGESTRNLREALSAEGPASRSAKAWKEYFSEVPRFSCSDEHMTTYYWYRWYGLRLNTIDAGIKKFAHPLVCEGPGPLRTPTARSAPGHIRENRWRHDPALAQGSLLAFVASQGEDGRFPGEIDPVDAPESLPSHADWGAALLELDAVHHSAAFLRQVHEPLVRQARYMDRELDRGGTGLYDDGAVKGVARTVSVYQLKRALASVDRALGKPGEAEILEIEADKIRNAVRSVMWNPTEEMFSDIDGCVPVQTNEKSATSFYPYFTDIVSADHLQGLHRHLLQSGEFWSTFPVPSLSQVSGAFRAEPESNGKRIGRPVNGRVWPRTNSYVAEALARCAVAFDDETLRKSTAALVRTSIRMLFTGGDAARPGGFEHYNPLTGAPSLYRGIDDHQDSWVVDLIIKYVCGIRPDGKGIVVDPFPFGLAEASIDEVMVRGRSLRVEIRKKKFTVWIDGAEMGTGHLGRGITLPYA